MWLRFLILFLISFSAFAAPKKVADLFPGLTNIDATQVFKRNSPQYLELINCQNATVKSTACDAAGIARFYDLSSGNQIDDSYDYVNRCVGMRGFKRYPKDVKESDFATTTGNKLVFSAGEVHCTGLENNEVISVQLVACYTRANGVHCGYATACFEGVEAKGECSKDYPSEDIFVTRNSVVSASSPPPLTVKCEPRFCHLGMTRKTICYTDGTNTSMQPLGGSCAAEHGSDPAAICVDPDFCNPPPPKYFCTVNSSIPSPGPSSLPSPIVSSSPTAPSSPSPSVPSSPRPRPSPIANHGRICGTTEWCPGTPGSNSAVQVVTCYEDGFYTDLLKYPLEGCLSTGALPPCAACP